MTDQTSPRIILAFGQRGILTDTTTAYARATLERPLPELAMPDPEAFDFVEEARIEARAGMDRTARDQTMRPTKLLTV